MNEEMKNEQIVTEETPSETPKTNLDEKKRSALLRYVAVLFAVAFALVLISLLGQMRHSMSTISQLNESSTSALAKVEQLQLDNQTLSEENAELQAELDEMKQELAEAQATARKEVYKYKTSADESKANLTAVQAAYESLLTSMQDETAEPAAIENYQDILGEAGVAAYDALFAEEEGE